MVAYEDIIGDGTNRGMCCVPDYYEGEFTDDMKKGAAYGLGAYAGFALIGTSLVLALELIGRRMGE